MPIPQGFNNEGFNRLLLHEDLHPQLLNPSDSGGGTLFDIGSAFSTDTVTMSNGSTGAHAPVALLVVIALAYLVASNRLGIDGLHLRVRG